MKSYYFVFGRTPELSFLELSSFVPLVQRFTNSIGKVQFSDIFEACSVFEKLGGSIKVAEYVTTIEKTDDQSLISLIQEHELFSLTVIGSSLSVNHGLLAAIKSQLKKEKKSVRYLAASEPWGISSASFYNELYELLLFPTHEGYEIAKTIKMQDINSWSQRDYGRPFADAKKGMLPPKVARMALNIAIGESKVSRPLQLLDPFCGMGTILGEALLLGCDVFGCDIQEQVITKAKQNIAWLLNQYSLTTKQSLFIQDATHISSQLNPNTIDLVVTEPFMGTPQLGEKTVSSKQIINVFRGLEKLYIGCLREWSRVLRQGGLVMIALPSVSFKHRDYFVKRVIDTCENLGYTTVLGPIAYGRPQAVVKRNFYLFRKVIK